MEFNVDKKKCLIIKKKGKLSIENKLLIFISKSSRNKFLHHSINPVYYFQVNQCYLQVISFASILIPFLLIIAFLFILSNLIQA